MVHDVADCLSPPLQVVLRVAAERHRAVLCGAISDLSITQPARYEQREGWRAGKVGEVCGAALTTGPAVVGNMLMRDTVMDVVASMSLLAKQIVFLVPRVRGDIRKQSHTQRYSV